MYSLVGIYGNAFAIMGYVTNAMKEVGCNKERIDAYINDAKSSDYNHLLVCSKETIDFCNEQAGCEDNEEEEE